MDKHNSAIDKHNSVGLFYITNVGKKVFHRSFKGLEALYDYLHNSDFIKSEDYKELIIVKLDPDKDKGST